MCLRLLELFLQHLIFSRFGGSGCCRSTLLLLSGRQRYGMVAFCLFYRSLQDGFSRLLLLCGSICTFSRCPCACGCRLGFCQLGGLHRLLTAGFGSTRICLLLCSLCSLREFRHLCFEFTLLLLLCGEAGC